MKRKLFKKTTERGGANKNVTAPKKLQDIPLFNVLLVAIFWVALVLFFYSGRLMRPQKLAAGQLAPETIVASTDFLAENLTATQAKQRMAADAVLPVFTLDTSALESAQWALTTNHLAQQFPSANPTNVQPVLFTALSNTICTGIISAGDAQTGFNNMAPSGKVTLRGGETETIRTLDSFVRQSDVLKRTIADLIQKLPRESRNEEILRSDLAPWLWPNLVYDGAETAARRAQALALVDPAMDPVKAGAILIRSGDVVSAQTLKWLTAHDKRLSELETPAERIQRLAGSGLLLLLGLAWTAAIAGIVKRPLLSNRRQALLLITLSALPLIAGKGMLYAAVDLQLLPTAVLQFALPLALAPMLASILTGSSAGIVAGFWVSFALATLLGGSFEVFVLGLLVSVTAVYTTRDVKHRVALFRAGFRIGALEMVFALVMAVLEHPSWQVLFPQLGAALLSGILSALLAMLLIPVFEHLFKITTDISLLELSDLSHPLLQSLAIHAPGTYHHSLMMASLAQKAAETIGANGLLLRVCAYFHDIGKLVKPGFFSENIQFSENPHDDLTPSMSTLVVVSHIKEGLMLAKKYKLPQVVLDGIEQHQGTGLVSVFYHRAKTKQKETGAGQPAINDQDFRYEGPRPQTREMAILMLADGCEAASRSLDKPTPIRIAQLISDLFDSRLRDGQLDECTLTLAELNQIKQSFVFSLTNMLHGRVAYPKDEGKKSNSKTPHDG